MPNVLDFTDGDANHEFLSKTGSGGLLNRQYLEDRPVETYLHTGEEPKYLLRNKQSGLRLSGADETQTIAPGDGYQALALCTDVRLLVVVGDPDGDTCHSLQYVDAVEARSGDAGFRTQSLVVESLDGRRWEFPCKGDLSAVTDYVDGAIQTWANVTRLLTDIESTTETATDHLEAGEHERAAETLEGAAETIELVVGRAAGLGARAGAEIGEQADTLLSTITELRRRVQIRRARAEHAGARRHWHNSAYERAATAYETAVSAYEQAIEMIHESDSALAEHGDAFPDADAEVLTHGRRRALSERELLRIWPRVEADTARRQAENTDDPETAAELWTDALDGYRDMLGLDWGKETRSFIVDRDRIREQTTEFADDAIEDHSHAGQLWLDSGDEFASAGRLDQATQVYERAREQYRRAHELASEVRPDRVDELERALATVEQRLTDADEANADIGGSTRRSSETGDARSTASDSDTSTSDSSQQVTEHSDSASNEDERASEPSVLDRIRGSKPQADGVSGAHYTDTTESAGGGGATAAGSGRPAGRSDAVAGGGSANDSAWGVDSGSSTSFETTGTAPATAELSVSRLRELDEKEFVELVAMVWDSRGWLTTVFTTASPVYDIVATREDTDERLLLWAVHDTGDTSVGSTRIDRCATTRENSNGADAATLVTAGSVTDAARTRARELDVTVLDASDFVELLEFENIRTDAFIDQ